MLGRKGLEEAIQCRPYNSTSLEGGAGPTRLATFAKGGHLHSISCPEAVGNPPLRTSFKERRLLAIVVEMRC